MIIVEGLDKCGKSTLVEYLFKHLPDPILIKNGYRPESESITERRKVVEIYNDILASYKENLLNNNVILDRYFISELVYSKKRGYNGFANHGMRSLIKQIEKRNDVILVYCKTDEETIAYNFKKDKEEYIDITEIKSLSNKYNEIMGKIQLPYIPYDFTMTEPDEICLKIKSIINYKFGK